MININMWSRVRANLISKNKQQGEAEIAYTESKKQTNNKNQNQKTNKRRFSHN